MAVGPLDKRTRKSRCTACARRKIKCEGGIPCNYCNKKNLTCTSQSSKSSNVVFIPVPSPSTIIINNREPGISSNVPEDSTTLFIRHFFSSFITENDFAVASLNMKTIKSQFQSSPGLHHVFIAIGALSLSRISTKKSKEMTYKALSEYRTSLVAFQEELGRNETPLNTNSGLWTTFFLGIFELMTDPTGQSWLTHILHGTSRLLLLRGPKAHLSGPGRSFFLTIRVFEISRSLIYAEPSFLCEKEWKSVTRKLWEGEGGSDWHPKEGLFDLMIECSGLAGEAWEVVDPETKYPPGELEQRLANLAFQGLHLRSSLTMWHRDFLTYVGQSPLANLDPRSVLASIYHHAIMIFLDGIFSYRCQFNNIYTPTLTEGDVRAHVQGIIEKTRSALGNTNLAGVLFFFPLRVAGARSVGLERGEVLGLLEVIKGGEFVVAEAFLGDLKALWLER